MFSCLTTRLGTVVAAVGLALAGSPAALAWSWPASGAVLAPFVVAPSEYEAGQHRGVDVAGTAGEPASSPSAGTVRFAGTLPRHGRSLTIETPDGYTVTLLHLGSVSVSTGADVAEGEPVGTIGRSGELEHEEPYVHLGVRRTADADGYVDPLELLPPRAAAPAPVPAAGPPLEPVPAAGPAQAAPAPVLSSGTAPTAVSGAVSPAASVVEHRAAAPRTGARPSRSGARNRPSAEPRSAVRSTRSLRTPARQLATGRARPAHSSPRGVRARPATPPQLRSEQHSRASVRRVLRVAAFRPAAPSSASATTHSGAAHRSGPTPPVRLSLVALALALAALLALAGASRFRRRGGRDDARMMIDDAVPEDPRSSGLAVRLGPAPHRPRRGVRGSVGHLRPLPPAQGRRRPDGQRHGRARHSGHGRRRQGGALTTRDR